MLKSLLKSASIATIAAVSCLSVSADDTPSLRTNFDNIYYFGDSLTDGRDANDGIYATGDTWAKTLSPLNNIPYNVTQNNFARQSARTYTQGATPIPGLIGSNNQIDNFVTTIGSAGSKDLIAIWIGHNDIQDVSVPITSDKLILAAKTTADNIATGVNRLTTLNAKNILVLNLASFANTPAFAPPVTQEDRNGADLYAQTFRSRIESQLKGNTGNLIFLDVAMLQREIFSDIGSYLEGKTQLTDFFLADGIHPNETGQAIFGNWVSDLLSAPLPFIAIPDYAVGMMDKSNQVIFARQNIIKHHCHDKAGLRLYAEGDMGESTLKKSATPYAAKSGTASIAIGLEAQAESRSTLGFKITHDSNNLKFNNAQSLKKVDLSETILSLYGFMFMGDHLNLAANASYGSIGVDTKREQQIGINTRSEPGTGTGQHFSIATQIGYDFDLMNNITLTPYVSAAYHQVKMDDIKEKNLTSTSLVYRLPKETAQFYRVGAEALGKFDFHEININPFVNIAAVKETRSRSNKVQARSTSFDRFFTLESAKVMKDDTYMDAQAGVNFGITCKDTISAKYGGKFFSSKQKSHYGSLAYSRAL